MAGRKLLIIGDSTNNKEGSSFVPYYERMLNRLLSGSVVGCVGLSVSSGNTTDVVGNGIAQSSRMAKWTLQEPDDSLPKALDFTPPGYRMGDGVVTNSPNGLTSFAPVHAIGLLDPTNISPAGEDWITGNNTMIGVGVVRGRSVNDWIDELQLRRTSNHGGSSGVNSWSSINNLGDQQVSGASDTIIRIGLEHTAPPSIRMGMHLRGPGSGDEPATVGKAVAICGAWVWNDTNLADEEAYSIDSLSIGGWSATNFADVHDSEDYAAYMSAMPFTPDTIVIWLGQNNGGGEWTGTVWTSLFETKITKIVTDIRAAYTSNGDPLPEIVLTVPPAMTGVYADSKFAPLRSTYAALATSLGARVLDLYTPPGNSLANIDAGYAHDGVHPTISGSDFVGDYFWGELATALQAASVVGSRSRGRGRGR